MLSVSGRGRRREQKMGESNFPRESSGKCQRSGRQRTCPRYPLSIVVVLQLVHVGEMRLNVSRDIHYRIFVVLQFYPGTPFLSRKQKRKQKSKEPRIDVIASNYELLSRRDHRSLSADRCLVSTSLPFPTIRRTFSHICGSRLALSWVNKIKGVFL